MVIFVKEEFCIFKFKTQHFLVCIGYIFVTKLKFKKMTDSEIIGLQNQLALSRREIHNLRQQLSTLTHIHQKEIAHIQQTLKQWQCQGCKDRSEKSSIPDPDTNSFKNVERDFKFKPIGYITTQFPEKRGTPRQPGICHDAIAKLTLNKDIFTNPCHALEGLQEFSHIWILFHFHKNDSSHVKAKVAPPRLNGIRTGVFASRSPHRPCPIGLSLVKIDRIMDNVIYFSGVDMVDKTPVFDIKPYIPQYDNPLHFNNPNTMINMLDVMDDLEESNNDSTTITVINNISDPSDRDSLQVIQLNEGPPSTREIVDGQETDRQTQVLEVPGSSESRNEASFYRRSSSRIGEREAPDGEEEEPAASGSQGVTTPIPSTSSGHVRVPAWIDQAPVSRLNVSFKDRALSQLSELGQEAEEKKKIITNVLQEDPRSIYLRERWGGHCYVFRIAELYVSCKFNDSNHSVTVYQVFKNERPQESDEP